MAQRAEVIETTVGDVAAGWRASALIRTIA